MTYIDQKRVELARALASNPRVLLLDEWLAGLNPSELNIGIKLIDKLSRQGRTIIMVEHVMDAIRSLCGRCVVMNSGRKIKEGDVAEVLSDPEVVEAYLGTTTMLEIRNLSVRYGRHQALDGVSAEDRQGRGLRDPRRQRRRQVEFAQGDRRHGQGRARLRDRHERRARSPA